MSAAPRNEAATFEDLSALHAARESARSDPFGRVLRSSWYALDLAATCLGHRARRLRARPGAAVSNDVGADTPAPAPGARTQVDTAQDIAGAALARTRPTDEGAAR